jgi:hypothetical protein
MKTSTSTLTQTLTYERLHEVLKYHPDVGIFINKIDRGGMKKGDVAGYKTEDNVTQIRVDGVCYLAHRLAWLYVYGYMPDNKIIHIDNIKWHNWISNLKETSNQCNSRNINNFSNNSSGVKGVTWRKDSNKWQAYIIVNCKKCHIGTFDDFDEAVCHRLAAEQCIGWGGCDSNSPAFKYVQKMLNP